MSRPTRVVRDSGRAEAFSNGVFAITITLSYWVSIRPPTDDTGLLHRLVALWPSYLGYAVTFLLVGQVWANDHVIFDNIRVADGVVLLLNTLLLMAAGLLPFDTSVLAAALRSGHDQRTAVAFYGIAFDVTALTFNAIWRYASVIGCSAEPSPHNPTPRLRSGSFAGKKRAARLRAEQRPAARGPQGCQSNAPIQSAMARPISSGESSWTK